MKIRIFIISLFITAISYSQDKGTIAGTLTDKDANNETLPFANVVIKGKNIGTITDINGKYTLSLGAGNYVVQYSFIGYEPIEAPITIIKGETLIINKALGSGGYKLDDVIIKKTINRTKETALLLEQKNAVEIKQAIGAEELSRKGVSDIATAVTKVSGISKQESSGSVFVRGLGDRYNVTTLNGLPLPSNNPANKNILLDIFSTDIVESIGISKTFESQNYADFGGANVDIVSKKMNGSPYLQLGMSIGANTNVVGLDHFYLQDGPSYSGFKKVSTPSNPLLPYNYSTSWDRQERKNTLNNNFSLSGGKKFNVGDHSSIGTFVTASFDADNKYTEGISRGSITAQGLANADYYKKSYKYNTNTTVMGTADYKINYDHSVAFTSLFLNSTSQDYSEYEGSNQNFDGYTSPGAINPSGFIKRGTFDKTKLFVNQLLGKHEINEKWNTNWAVGYSVLENVIPDRMQNTLVPIIGNPSNYMFFTDSSIHNHRYFHNLEENELSTNLSTSYNFKKSDDSFKGMATLGYSGKMKDVNFDSQQYAFFPSRTKIITDIHNIDSELNAANFNSSGSSKLSQFYKGHLTIHSAYGNILYNFTEKLSVILGGRYEKIEQYVHFVTSLTPNEGSVSNYTPTKFLPSLIAKYKLNDKQNLKFAASNTYTLPQFKEKVEMIFQDVEQDYQGNKSLYASTNYNVDLSWELYPSKDELLTVTTFGKLIQNPINEMFQNSSSGNITYANTGEKAVVVGVELELRKNVFELKDDNDLKEKLTIGFNGSYMYHNQDLSNDKVFNENGFGANFTFANSKLSGASDFLANADVSFLKEFKDDKDITATLTYSYVSDKLAVIGTQERGNLIDKSIDRLDFILKSSLTENLKIGLSYKNILNPAYERVTEQSKAPVIEGSVKKDDVVAKSYKIGSNLSLSLTYKF